MYGPSDKYAGKIEKEIESVSPKDQLKLLEKLCHHLGKARLIVKKEHVWKSLYGFAKVLSGDEEAQQYVNRLREDRV